MKRFAFSAMPLNRDSIIESEHCRITVLTPCMLRLESGIYMDSPTQTVWNRDLGAVSFDIKKHRNIWTVTTDEVSFSVNIAKGTMESVTLKDGSVVTDFNKGNLLGTARTLDNVNGAVRLEKGILSRSGVAVMDDSKSLPLMEDGTIVPRPACNDLYYFAYGHDYLRCLKDFFKLTGSVPLIPKYALGNWWSRYKAYTQEEYQKLMQEFIDRKLPVTVATIDMDWHWTDVIRRFGEDARPKYSRNKMEAFYNQIMPGWTGYSWNTDLFPDYKAMLQWLHDNGFHITVNVHPSQGIRFFEDCYEDVCKAMQMDPARKETVKFDIADKKFVEVYLDHAHHPYEENGVDFWWLDWQQGKTTDIPGLDPLWALNHYHTLDNGRGEKRPLILSRYAGLGSHRYPLGFSGDTICTWKSLNFQPYFTNNAANAGYTWWSHDIGGHMRGVQDDELYLRWLQYGVFSPINRLHSSNSDFMGKEPWKRCYAVEKAGESFLRLRHKLIPYLYTANYQTHKEGTPICMPLYYVHDCDDAYKAKNQYYFGSQLMVCPVTQPLDHRLNLANVRVWLPEGRWTDFFNGRIYQGGQWVNMYRDLDAIPVLAPAGAIVPMYQNAQSNDLSLGQPLEIHVWRGNGKYELYEDDGETKAFQDAHFAITPMEVQEQSEIIRFVIEMPKGDRSILPKERPVTIRFRDVVSAEILVNGKTTESIAASCVTVPVFSSGERVEIELKNWTAAKNIPLEESSIALLTRVQAGNDWKGLRFRNWRGNEKKMPKYVTSALSELKALDYSI